MSDAQAIQVLQVLVLVGCVPATLYPLIYGFGSPWWVSWVGRALLLKGVSIAILFDLSGANIIFGHLIWEGWLAIGSYSLVVIAITFQFAVMLYLQHEGRRIRRAQGRTARSDQLKDANW